MRLKENALFTLIIIIIIIVAVLNRMTQRVSIPVVLGSALGSVISVATYEAYLKDKIFHTDDIL